MKFGLGQSALREEDKRFLRGQGRYTDDINLPGQAWSYILRSPTRMRASARSTRKPPVGRQACWRSLPVTTSQRRG